MICRECKTIIVEDDEYVSCDICFKVWCEACIEVAELLTCEDCNRLNCRHCSVTDIDPKTQDYTGEVLCRYCEESGERCQLV